MLFGCNQRTDDRPRLRSLVLLLNLVLLLSLALLVQPVMLVGPIQELGCGMRTVVDTEG
jgi:hypothetical protein